ncbi:MAG: hypothetical protein IKG22_03350 [Atopobiaceae bacterium]|nr:hypothetical protein [Atopobiaceae bacterium]
MLYSKRSGKVIASKTVAAGKTSTTFKDLKPGKKYYARVRMLRPKGGKTYVGALGHYHASSAS